MAPKKGIQKRTLERQGQQEIMDQCICSPAVPERVGLVSGFAAEKFCLGR